MEIVSALDHGILRAGKDWGRGGMAKRGWEDEAWDGGA